MSFYLKYDLERMIADGPVKTFRAVEKSAGRPVLLHLFSAEGLTMRDAMLRRLVDATGKSAAPLIESGEFAGSAYAVTEVVQPFTSFREWVEPLPRPVPLAATAVATPPVPAAKTEPGEFTRIFGPMPESLDKAPDKPPVKAPIPLEPPVAPPGKPCVGELADAPPPRSASAHEMAPWPAPQPPAPKVIDDFARMTGKAAGPPPPRSAWPGLPEAGAEPASLEDSTLFGSKLVSQPIDLESTPELKQPDNKPFRPAGEFTRMFGPGDVPGRVPVPPPAANMPMPAPPPPPPVRDVPRGATVSSLFDLPDIKQPLSGMPPGPPPLIADDYATATAAPKDSESPRPAPSVAPVAATNLQPLPPMRHDRTLILLGSLVGLLAATTLVLLLVRC